MDRQGKQTGLALLLRIKDYLKTLNTGKFKLSLLLEKQYNSTK
jgi:hypothetical protein